MTGTDVAFLAVISAVVFFACWLGGLSIYWPICISGALAIALCLDGK